MRPTHQPKSRRSVLPARSTSAHCAMKASSAIVATERPIITQDHHPPKSAIRCTSARGRIDRKPQPTTNSADIHKSCRRWRATSSGRRGSSARNRHAVHPHAATFTAQMARSNQIQIAIPGEVPLLIAVD